MISTLLLAAAADGVAKLGAGVGAGLAAIGAGIGIGRIGYDCSCRPYRGCCSVRCGGSLPLHLINQDNHYCVWIC